MLACRHPGFVDVLIEPDFHVIQILGVGSQPVDSREVTLVSQFGIQCPEDFNNSKSGLADRLRNITARRRYGSDNGQIAFTGLPAQRHNTAGAFIELGQTGTQVSRVAFLTGHLFQTAGHFTKSLGPTAGRVSHQGDGITHIAEVLGDGDTGVNRGLTGRNRHIRGIGDQNGAVHQGLAALGIFQGREFVQNIGHLVAALAAADINDDVCLRPLGQLVLNDRFTGPEGAGNSSNTAFGNGEEGIDNTLTGDQRHIGSQLLLIGAALADGPALHKGQIFFAVFGRYGSDRLVDGKTSGRDRGKSTFDPVGDHDLLGDQGRFFDGSDDVAGNYLVADLGGSFKVPFLFAVQRRYLDTAGQQIGTGDFHDLVQGTLDTIVDRSDQTGAQFDGKRHICGFYRFAGAQAAGFLVYLDGGLVTVHFDDLADQSFFGYADNVIHVGVAHTFGNDQRAGNFFDRSFAHWLYHYPLTYSRTGYRCRPPVPPIF